MNINYLKSYQQTSTVSLNLSKIKILLYLYP